MKSKLFATLVFVNVGLVLLSILACSLVSPIIQPSPTSTPLPTFTPTSIPTNTPTSVPSAFAVDKYELHTIFTDAGWQLLEEGMYVMNPLLVPDAFMVETDGEKITSVGHLFSETNIKHAISLVQTIIPTCLQAEKFISQNAYEIFNTSSQGNSMSCNGYFIAIGPGNMGGQLVVVLKIQLQ